MITGFLLIYNISSKADECDYNLTSASHAPYISHPDQIAQLIVNAAKAIRKKVGTEVEQIINTMTKYGKIKEQ